MPYQLDDFYKNLEKKKNHAEGYREYVVYIQAQAAEKASDTKGKEHWKDYLAKIITARQMASQEGEKNTPFQDELENDNKGLNRLAILNTNLWKPLNTLKEDPIYNDMTNDMSVKDIQKACANPGEFTLNLGRRIAHYGQFKGGKQNEHLRSIADKMRETGTRVGGNSPRYEAALKAMSTPVSPWNVCENIKTVKAYLFDKANPRRTKTGKKRFENCMKYLHDTMPPDEFSKYCYDINRQRGSLDRNHKNHISPEMFGKKRSLTEIVNDIRQKHKNGYPITDRDCAVIAAGYELVSKTDPKTGKKLPIDPHAKIDPMDLANATDSIHDSDEMGEWLARQKPEDLENKLMSDFGVEIANYKSDNKRVRADEKAKEEAERKAEEERKKAEDPELKRKEEYDKNMADNKTWKKYTGYLKDNDREAYDKLKDLRANDRDAYEAEKQKYLQQVRAQKQEKENPEPRVEEKKQPVKAGGGPVLGGV